MQSTVYLLQGCQPLRLVFRWNAFGSCISNAEVAQIKQRLEDGIKALPHRKLEPLSSPELEEE